MWIPHLDGRHVRECLLHLRRLGQEGVQLGAQVQGVPGEGLPVAHEPDQLDVLGVREGRVRGDLLPGGPLADQLLEGLADLVVGDMLFLEGGRKEGGRGERNALRRNALRRWKKVKRRLAKTRNTPGQFCKNVS